MLLLIAAGLVSAGARAQESRGQYDLFLKSDAGRVSVWIDTATGDFRWVDARKSIDITGRGTLAFPNLGPVVLWYAGEVPGFDWALLALKIYGNTATGSLTLFPTGERSRRTVSLFHDKDTRDDGRSEPQGATRPPPPQFGDLDLRPPPEVPPAPTP